MKALFMSFLSAIEGLIIKIKVDLEAIGSALWPAIEAAFTTAEQAEINSLIPIAENVLAGVNAGTDPKVMFTEALAALETSLVNAGKTFVLTLATQALTLAIDKLKGNTGAGNEGVLSGGSTGPTTS